jgi:hypothetical protein
MASEGCFRQNATGVTLYTVLRNRTGQVYNKITGKFETQANSTWPTGAYSLFMTETPASGYFYVWDMPVVPWGSYYREIYQRLAGSPSLTDTPICSGMLYWAAPTIRRVWT